jgi:hypothetical protein
MAKKATNGKVTAPILPQPRTISQSPLYTLVPTIRDQFRRVELRDANGAVKAILIDQDQKKEQNVGEANLNFLCGLILGATGGRGDKPDGACIWVAGNATQMKNLNDYILYMEPRTRGTILEAPVSRFLSIVSARAAVLGPSLEKYPPTVKVRDVSIGAEEEEVEVVL